VLFPTLFTSKTLSCEKEHITEKIMCKAQSEHVFLKPVSVKMHNRCNVQGTGMDI